jgi:hypothetical protein
MATVKLTSAIENSIRENVCKPFDDRIALLTKEIEKHPEFGKAMYDLYVPVPVQTKAAELNCISKIKWFHVSRTIRVRLTREVYDTVIFTLEFATEYVVPRDFSSWSVHVDITEDAPAFALIADRLHKIDKLKTEKAELKTELLDPLFGNCVTLKQALVVWPSILDFVHPSIRERHFEPAATKTRTKKRLEEVEITDTAKHLITKSRFLSV